VRKRPAAAGTNACSGTGKESNEIRALTRPLARVHLKGDTMLALEAADSPTTSPSCASASAGPFSLEGRRQTVPQLSMLQWKTGVWQRTRAGLAG